ncbi:HEAT repeat domain-containing protein [Mycoavidus sp. B2-EB]|uniref:HEAT repeat domain-containing protein n=1 Tax=Mycoavidus sp. B2-EB TaxID=2651972 RepID=UPI00162401D1|nr:HEAT repeat domain-containing protein [Mycoavidus sp. B2-EB]BBO59667.1 hypothetical protein MPB2EB_0791 [Mycoavidus sp. B2-EB]
MKIGILLNPIKTSSISPGCSTPSPINRAPEKNDQPITRKDSGIGLPPSPQAGTSHPPSSPVQKTDSLAYVVPQDDASVREQRHWMTGTKQTVKPLEPTESKTSARVRQAVSHGLNRLKQLWLTPRPTTQQNVSRPFTWMPFWATPPSAPLVNPIPRSKLATALYPLTPLNPRLQKLSTQAISLAALRNALYQHYECAGLSTQPLSAQNAALDTCYANLTRIEHPLQPQSEHTALTQPSTASEQQSNSESHSTPPPKSPITLNHLFEPQTLRDGSIGQPKRVLLHGQADSGKTVVCKKLVSDYQHHALWHNRFDCVLWLPLAQLKTDQPLNLKILLCEHFFAHQANAQALAQTFERHQAKTLFILDGLDEVIGELEEGRPLHPLLQELLSQTHVLITSRPVGVNSRALGQFDLELETVGLNLDDVQAYVQNFIPESNPATIQQLMQSTSLTQGPVNLPLLLDALCANWEKRHANQDITLATLYEAIVNQLWRKDCVRLKKRHQGERLEPLALQNLPQTILEELIAPELHALSYLAFKGLEAGTLEVDLDKLTQDQARLGIKSPFWLRTDLKHTSFLHTTDIRLPEVERRYHFLHPSLQEFFAAKFLAQQLKIDAQAEQTSAHTNKIPVASGLILSPTQLHVFIAEHKYDPRYEPMWQMLAGLLKGAALEHFFTLLEETPQDLLSARHQHVMMGCVQVARAQLEEKTIDRLETEWLQWLHFEISLNLDKVSALGRQPGFPEHLLLTYLHQPNSNKATLIRTLNARSTLSHHATQAIISVLLKPEENKEAKSAAAEILGQQHTLSDAVVQALSTVLQNEDEDEDVRIAAIGALGRQKPLAEAVILTLISALLDANWEIRYAAGKILGRLETLPDTALKILIAALQNKEKHIRSTATEALGQQQPLSDIITQALVAVLLNKSEDKEIRGIAANAFSSQQTLSEATIDALLTVLRNKDENEELRASAAEVFSWREPFAQTALQILISLLLDKDEKEYIRSTAAQVLNRRKIIPETAIQALSTVLQDKNEKENIRVLVAKALNNQETLPPCLTQTLLSVLKSELGTESLGSRIAAADTLGQETVLSEEIIQDLTEIVQNQDETWRIRLAAIQALHRQPRLPANTCRALIIALTDEHQKTRSAAAMVLSRQENLSNEVMQAWIAALSSADQDIQAKAIKSLGQHQTLPEHAKLVLTQASLDQQCTFRIEAIQALSKQKELTEAVIQAWDSILKNKAEDASLRSSIAQALGQPETLAGNVIQTLVTLIADPNEEDSVISAAAKALNQQKIQTETVIQAWAAILKNKARGKLARSTAATALGQPKALPETVMQTLATVLAEPNEADSVIFATAKALNQQEILPDAVLQTLVATLEKKKNDKFVLSAITKILNLHIDRLYTLLPSLTPEQIQSLYMSVLFPWSCAHIAPLYMHNNRLHFYTTAGLKKSISLTTQHMGGFMNTWLKSTVPLRHPSFKEIQTRSRAYRSSPVEPSLIRELASPTSIPSGELARLCTDIQGHAHLV